MTLTLKINRERNWTYFYIFYLVLSSYSVYMYLNPKIATPIQLGMLLISMLTLLRFYKTGIKKSLLFIASAVVGLFTAVTVVTTVDTFSTVLLGLRFLMILMCVFVFLKRNQDILTIIYQVLFFLMIFYFCCYVIFDLLAPGLGLTTIREPIVNRDGISTFVVYECHFGFYYRWATSASFLGIKIKRFSGFCWEPGMYQIYLNYILMYLLFFDKAQKRNWKRIGFTLLNVVLCTSSMGYLVAVFMLMIALMLQKNKVLRVVCFIPLSIIGFMAIRNIIVTKNIEAVYSFSNRTSELSLISDVLFRNSILGEAVSSQISSNGLIRFLWSYGYLAVAVCVYIGICIGTNNSRMCMMRQKMAFTIWLVLSLVNEPIEFFSFTFLIIAFLIAESPKLAGRKRVSPQMIEVKGEIR